MQRISLKFASTTLMSLVLALVTVACSDDGTGEESASSETSGDGDGDGDASGDGDGDDPTDSAGDGDGDDTTDSAGDGDGDDPTDSAGDGDGDDPTDSGDGDGDDTTGPGGDLTFEGDVYPIIAASCSCHVAGAPAGLSMPDAATAYANIVGVASSQSPELNRIEAGDPENSYLMQKVRGVAASGGQMPQGGPALPDMEQMIIGDWIAQGAPL